MTANARSKVEDPIIQDGKIYAVMSYLSILCIVPLLLKKENSFVLSHGKQGLILFVGEVAVFIAHIILGLWFLRLGMFIFGVISFIGILSVLQGRYLPLPIIHSLSEKITL